MAQRIETLVHLIDDIDGGAAEKTIYFGWEGKSYEIDLAAKNAKAIEKAVTDLLPHARLVRTSAKTGKRMMEVKTGPDPKAVRAWAASQGLTVNRLGKVPSDIVEQYEAAGN